MKPLYWGLGLLAALLILCLGSTARLAEDSRQTEQALRCAAEAARCGDEDRARECAAQARRHRRGDQPRGDR